MSTAPQERNAYELLSKPTLELTDADVTDICTELRKKRERFLAGVKDNPPKVSKAAPPKTPEEKAALTDNLLGDIGNLF